MHELNHEMFGSVTHIIAKVSKHMFGNVTYYEKLVETLIKKYSESDVTPQSDQRILESSRVPDVYVLSR